MPETTVTEAVTTAVSEGAGQGDWLVIILLVMALAALVIGIVRVFLEPASKKEEKCECCESGGKVIGGVRMSDTEFWVKDAKFCPLCGKPLAKDEPEPKE